MEGKSDRLALRRYTNFLAMTSHDLLDPHSSIMAELRSFPSTSPTQLSMCERITRLHVAAPKTTRLHVAAFSAWFKGGEELVEE